MLREFHELRGRQSAAREASQVNRALEVIQPVHTHAGGAIDRIGQGAGRRHDIGFTHAASPERSTTTHRACAHVTDDRHEMTGHLLIGPNNSRIASRN